MENKLDDFVAGVEATFGQLVGSREELSSFLRAAEDFYLDFIGASRPSTSTACQGQLPFWRYLIYYATLTLDHAAESASDEEQDKYKDLASELSSCWPLLSVLVPQQYSFNDLHPDSQPSPQNLPDQPKKLGSPHRTTTIDLSPPRDTEISGQTQNAAYVARYGPTRPHLPRHPSVMRAVEAVTPPINHSDEHFTLDPDSQNQPIADSSLWDAYLERASSGRSLSESTQLTNSSSSTQPSDILKTPPIHQDPSPIQFPASTPMGKTWSSSSGATTAQAGYTNMRSDSTTPTLRNTYQQYQHHQRVHSQSQDTKVLLADRGDSTAKIVTKPQGGNYELDVAIGGNSVIFDPDRPGQIQYTGPKLPAPRSPVNKPEELQMKVLLADRGDNTAKLVPTLEGTYVLDVSIGGRKLLLNPERPAEIQYHDQQGAVVTQSLISPAIHAQ